MGVHVDYCGEIYPVTEGGSLVIGRTSELAIDDNPYLHRRFLEVSVADQMVWLANVGTRLSATVSDDAGLMQAWLAPGARVPLVFARTAVWFTAGPTTYEFEIVSDRSAFVSAPGTGGEVGQTTVGRVNFTRDQQLLVLSLAEDVLRRGNRGAGTIPTSNAAAQRLGWAITKFNRKLDNVCDKLTKAGVRGLHGSAGKLATSRRARLVEYAVAARLVSTADLALLDAVASADDG